MSAAPATKRRAPKPTPAAVTEPPTLAWHFTGPLLRDGRAIPADGTCHCGCGAATKVAIRTDARAGVVAGQPLRFRPGHNKRVAPDLSRYVLRDCGYTSPCWCWTGSVSRKGYGRVQIAGRHTGAHRAVYQAERGFLHERLHLDHLCRNRLCVRPDHLEAVSSAVNTRRAARTKLTEEQAATIRSSALPQSDLARLYGVSRQTVSDIRRGTRWKTEAHERQIGAAP